MGSNFEMNIKKETKDEDELEDEIEEEIEFENSEEKEIKKDQKDAKSKMIKFMVIFMAIFFGLLIILWLISIIKPRSYTYEEVEMILENAAKSYFTDYPENLPKTEGSGVEVDYTNLVAAEKMKDLSVYVGENKTCTATVQVQKAGEDYLYTPYLNCGEDYMTMELYKAVQNQGTVPSGQYGLYKINGEYVYRGEKVNNYVQLDEGLWRIVKVTQKGVVVLIKDNAVGSSVPYDDRYNLENEWSSGINSYSASRLKDSIEKMYQDPNKDLNELFLSANDKKRLIKYNLCIGKRAEEDTGTDNTIECKTTQANTKVGLLTVSEYMRASIDSNCTYTTSKSCSNYNYLKSDFPWWLVTADTSSSSTAYAVTDTGIIKKDTTILYEHVRPVIYLNERTMYKSGEGTKTKPFKLK